MDRRGLFGIALLEDVTVVDLYFVAAVVGYVVGWALRIHDRRVWDDGHAAGAAAQRLRAELEAEHAPSARALG